MNRFVLRYSPRLEIITQNETAYDKALVQVIQSPLEWADATMWFEVPKGFMCDGASVPNSLYPMLDANAFDLLIPGIAHDYLYRKDATVIDIKTSEIRSVSRLEADEVMRNVCKFVGVDWFDRQKIFYAIRVGGHPSFRQKTVDWMV